MNYTHSLTNNLILRTHTRHTSSEITQCTHFLENIDFLNGFKAIALIQTHKYKPNGKQRPSDTNTHTNTQTKPNATQCAQCALDATWNWTSGRYKRRGEESERKGVKGSTASRGRRFEGRIRERRVEECGCDAFQDPRRFQKRRRRFQKWCGGKTWKLGAEEKEWGRAEGRVKESGRVRGEAKGLDRFAIHPPRVIGPFKANLGRWSATGASTARIDSQVAIKPPTHIFFSPL